MPEPKLTKDELRQQLTAALVIFHGEITHCAPGAAAQDGAEQRRRRLSPCISRCRTWRDLGSKHEGP
jgi:hypothetical protein